jgi:monomeric sarcosine oxidase
MDRAEVVVIGAGVMGSATARTLGERGVDTVLLEQFRVGHARGSSHGAVRIFRLTYPQADYVRMAMRAFASWHDLEQRAGETLLVQTGGLDFGPGVDECAEAMTECGLPGEWLSAREAEERFPVFALDGVDRVLWHEQTGICLADRAVAAQVRLAREAGVDVREETPMTAIRPGGGGVVVETASGEIRAAVAVVAGGGWNRWILEAALGTFAEVGVPLPLEVAPRMVPTVQDVSYFRARDPSAEWPVLIEWLEHMWYAAPSGGGPGIKVGRHLAGRAVDPSEGPFDTLPEFQRDCAEYVRRRCPGLDPEPVDAETCLYTMTADEDFVLDRVGPLVVGGGCSGHGFKFGPLIGEVLADLATGRDSDLPMERFSALRPALQQAFAV